MSSFTLLLLVVLATTTSALYFDVKETETRCFIEEVPDETIVVGALLQGVSANLWFQANTRLKLKRTMELLRKRVLELEFTSRLMELFAL
jgi:hypothetical protein